MKTDTDIIALRQPESVDDPLTEIAREAARRMLAAALRAEAEAFVAQHAEETLPDGRQRVVRHGYGPERSIQTGIGALDVQRPKVRDRATDAPAEKKIRFTSGIPAEMGVALAQPRCPAADPRPARSLDGRCPGSAGCDLGEGCAEPVAECDLAPDRGVATGICGAIRFDTSTYHYKSLRMDEAHVERRIREIAGTNVRLGYRRGRQGRLGCSTSII